MDGARPRPHAGHPLRAPGAAQAADLHARGGPDADARIGANTAIFSLLYQILLRPLPYPDAERLVFVWNTYPLMGLPQASVSIPDYIDRKTQAPAIEDATLFTAQR